MKFHLPKQVLKTHQTDPSRNQSSNERMVEIHYNLRQQPRKDNRLVITRSKR